jgi:cytochrome c peroxidase
MSDASGIKNPMGQKGHVILWATVFFVLFSLLACNDEKPEVKLGEWSGEELEIIASLSPPPKLPPSPGNRVADDPAARDLGHKLFFDTRLSESGEMSCATCHQPELYFTDGLETPEGIKRHTPSIIGAQYLPFLFWDGHKDSLWAQVLSPIENPDEQGLNRLALAHVIHKHYKAEYEAIFGALPDLMDLGRFPAKAMPLEFDSRNPLNVAWVGMMTVDRDAINTVAANVGKSIAAYERMLFPRAAPFDAYVETLLEGDTTGGGHLSDDAQRGLRAFIGKAQCVNCHNGPLLTDKSFHNLVLPRQQNATFGDLGRSLGAAKVKMDPFRCGEDYSDTESCEELDHLDPKFEDFFNAFKTPSLRNVAKTAPYMHTGQFASLEEVVSFYRTLPDEKDAFGHRELVLKLLDRSVDTGELVAFLESLTGPLPDERWLKPPKGGHQ